MRGRRLRYEDYIESDRWRRKRVQALKHYRGRCLICGELGADEVHHATYIHLGAERMHELATLHSECHDAVTRIRSLAAEGLKNLEPKKGGVSNYGEGPKDRALPRHDKGFDGLRALGEEMTAF